MAYYYTKTSIKMTNLTIAYNMGGLFDQEGQRGISHLMEHLVCETFKDEYPELAKYNVKWNACTSYDVVKVYFTGLDKYFTPEWKRRLVNKLTGGLKMSKERFEAEKKIVLQEYMDCFNEPANSENIIRQKFGFYSPIGKREDIEAFTYEDMQAYYEKHMCKPAKIVEVGPTKTDFSAIPMQEEYVVQPMKPKYKKDWKLPLEPTPENQKCDVSFLSKKAVNKADYPALAVAINMLVNGLESPMTHEIREVRHLTYGVSGGTIKFISYAYPTFGATTDKENKDNLVDAFKFFFDDIEKHLDKKRFEDMICKIEVDREYDKIFKYANVDKIINKGKIQIGNAYKKLTFEKVVEIAKKYLKTENFDIIIE